MTKREERLDMLLRRDQNKEDAASWFATMSSNITRMIEVGNLESDFSLMTAFSSLFSVDMHSKLTPDQ